MTEILRVNQLDYYYRDRKVLDNINVSFNKGEFVGITGKNGSGKSTLAKLLAGLERPVNGGVFFDNREIDEKSIKDIRSSLSMVFQNPNNQIIATRVIDDMAFALENIGMPRDEMVQTINQTSRRLSIEDLLQKNPEDLSGGQKQIVAIGGILLFNPKVIILDEVTSMLDLLSKKRVFDLIKELRKNHSIIMITHDSKELAQTDRVIILDEGRVAEDLTPGKLFSDIDLLEKYDLEEPFEYELKRSLGSQVYRTVGKLYED